MGISSKRVYKPNKLVNFETECSEHFNASLCRFVPWLGGPLTLDFTRVSELKTSCCFVIEGERSVGARKASSQIHLIRQTQYCTDSYGEEEMEGVRRAVASG